LYIKKRPSLYRILQKFRSSHRGSKNINKFQSCSFWLWAANSSAIMMPVVRHYLLLSCTPQFLLWKVSQDKGNYIHLNILSHMHHLNMYICVCVSIYIYIYIYTKKKNQSLDMIPPILCVPSTYYSSSQKVSGQYL
jgi:hypothetical protein